MRTPTNGRGAGRSSRPFVDGEVSREDVATHHSSWFLKNTNGNLEWIKAPMLDHFDDEILQLIGVQEPPRHDSDWLDIDTASRPIR